MRKETLHTCVYTRKYLQNTFSSLGEPEAWEQQAAVHNLSLCQWISVGWFILASVFTCSIVKSLPKSHIPVSFLLQDVRNCAPFKTSDNGLPIAPCGAIANSMFNGR